MAVVDESGSNNKKTRHSGPSPLFTYVNCKEITESNASCRRILPSLTAQRKFMKKMVSRFLSTSFPKIEICLWSGLSPFEEIKVNISRWQNAWEFPCDVLNPQIIFHHLQAIKGLKTPQQSHLFSLEEGFADQEKSTNEKTFDSEKNLEKANKTTPAPARDEDCSTWNLVTSLEFHDTSPSSLADLASTAAEE